MLGSLTSFRLAYMRLLAEAWSDKELERELLKSDDIMEILNNVKKPYYFSSPWPHIKVQLIKRDEVKWDPMATAGWICPNDYFIINLPTQNEAKGYEVQALAAYYQEFPTLLGVNKKPDENNKKDSVPYSVGGAIADLGIDPTPFLEFGGVTLRALALAWKNTDPNNFRNELFNNNLDDATPVLSKYLGFNNPWNFMLQFVESSEFTWDKDNHKWIHIPQNIIKMHYPPKPEKDEYMPIALTSYNNTGPAYPFTC